MMQSAIQSKKFILNRARFLGGVFIAAALLLVVRLYFLQIVHGAAYRSAAAEQYVEVDPNASQSRGEIYFTTKDGQLVAAAVSETGYLIAINPQKVTDPAREYQQLNALTPINKQTFMNAAKKSGTYVEVAGHIQDNNESKIIGLNLPGVIVASDSWREYPGGPLAAQVLGFIGYQNNSPIATGEYGLEKEYDNTLSEATEGLYVNPFAEIFTNVSNAVSPNAASTHGSIITSIEPNVEQELDSTLQQIMKQYTPQFDGGIIMDPRTGDIIAMAQEPSFDPNNYGAASDPSAYLNRLVSDRYEMGSIMKPLTMAVGVDSGAVTASTTYNDTACITVSGYKVCNYDHRGRGVIPMVRILDESLNVGASWVATQAGYPTFTRYFRSFGLDSKTGIDLPNEQVGDLANLGNGTGPAVNFDTAAFGQGITVTPIEMIRALSILANDGKLPNPHVVTGIQYESGITRSIGPGTQQQVISPATAQTVTNMLENVYDYYELNGAIRMQHYTAAAKTGTAQIPDPSTGGYLPNTYLQTFFGYFPATNPKFIVFLYADKPIGQEYSAYTWDIPYLHLERYLINYYNIPPDR